MERTFNAKDAKEFAKSRKAHFPLSAFAKTLAPFALKSA